MILPEVGQGPIFNAINFAYASTGRQGTVNAGAINYTGLSARVSVYICPADSRQIPPLNKLVDPVRGRTFNAYSQCSYAGVVGTADIFRWSCGCPARRSDGVVCFARAVELMPDGAFGYNHAFPLREFADGLSNTLLVGEFARFPEDPDTIFNVWSTAVPISSPSTAGVTRPQSLATTVPRLNAGLRIPDHPASSPISWGSEADNWNMGQFGFRSTHGGGAHFVFADGAVKFLKDAINVERVYRPLSTRSSHDPVSGGAY
jgi:prepilin-type processing-associated H-X9-DG protein